jgi:hypothetical protein
MHQPLSPALAEFLEPLISEAEANEARSQRRARYWLTGLAISARALKLREYIGKINKADVQFLRTDPNITETVNDLHALAREAKELAWVLSGREDAA